MFLRKSLSLLARTWGHGPAIADLLSHLCADKEIQKRKKEQGQYCLRTANR